MLTHQAKRVDPTRADSGRASPSNREKSPTAFMFIDSSNGGVNAKPDKIVRSFVMKSARNKKPWSTRPKSPKSELSVNCKASRGLSCRTGTYNTQLQASNPYSLKCYTPPMPLERWTVTSPSSSRSNSVFSSNSSNWTVNSPASAYTSPCAENSYADDAFSSTSTKRPSLSSRSSLITRSLGSFDCLAVQLDINTKHLLHRCKLTHKNTLDCY